MLKSQYIELVQDITGERFKVRTIALHIENAWNTVVGQVFKTNPSQLDLFCKMYEAAVIQASSSVLRPYALLPARIIQTVDLANGVRRVHPIGSEKLDFVPIPGFGFQLFSEVGLENMDDTAGYLVKADRVEFWNLRYPIARVRMDLVVPFSSWAMTDDIPTPLGTATTIIQMAVQTMMGNKTETNIYKK